MEIALQVVAAKRTGDDRAGAFPRANGHLIVLADGAGGMSGGAVAAEAVLAGARCFPFRAQSDCIRFLETIDRQLENVGQTTAVVLVISNGSVFGASVGDSDAWMLGFAGVADLTEHQTPKPLLGSGCANPVAFGPLLCQGRVLVASDGLFKYVQHERIRQIASTLPLQEVPSALVAAARLHSGALQDDIAVIVAGQQAIPADRGVERRSR